MTYDEYYELAEGRTVFKQPPPPTQAQQQAYARDFQRRQLAAKNENRVNEIKADHRAEVKKLLAEIASLKATIKSLQDHRDIFGEPPVVAEAVTDVEVGDA